MLKRAILLYAPVFVACVALIPTIYYGLLGAERQHPLHSLLVFDLGGITHFSKQNQFPVSWTPEQAEQLTESCYQPSEWNYYWNNGPCTFVMKRIEGEEKIFGTSALSEAWRRAVMNHPIAYLRHRATFMATFLGGANLTMWTDRKSVV